MNHQSENELQTTRHQQNKDLHPLASRRCGGGGHHRPQWSGEAAGVSGPVRTGAGGMAHGDGTGGTGKPQKSEVSLLISIMEKRKTVSL